MSSAFAHQTDARNGLSMKNWRKHFFNFWADSGALNRIRAPGSESTIALAGAGQRGHSDRGARHAVARDWASRRLERNADKGGRVADIYWPSGGLLAGTQ